MRIEQAVNIDDLRDMARRRLPRVVFDYLDGGAEDEVTLNENRQAFARTKLRPKLLGGGKVDLRTELLGQSLAAPLMIGPTGLNGLYWPDGDLVLARAAEKAGIGFALSTASNKALEDVAASVDTPLWFQLYPWGQPDFSRRLLERAEAAEYSAVMITLDSLVAGKRERDLRHGFSHEIRMSPSVILDGLLHPQWLSSVWLSGKRPRFENLVEFLGPGTTSADLAKFTRAQRNPHFSWEDVRRIRKQWKGPLLIKGVMCSEDAVRAREEGADGLVVSNHGGRQLDGSPATLQVLPEIIEAVDETLPVLLDGGVRRGSDIMKALALGAKCVLLGRATLYGLAAGGREGVDRALSILLDEMCRTMLLIGCETPGELGGKHLWHAD